MLLALIQRYSLKIVFALTLLLGLQLPNFLQQYEIRLDGHYIEALHHLEKYQELANLYFSEDLQALINKHKNSEEQVFRDEAVIINDLRERFVYLQAQKEALDSSLTHRLFFLSQQLNSPLFNETKRAYQAEIVLNKDAISVGLVVALASSLLLELLFFIIPFLLKKTFSYIKKNKSTTLKKS
ncbi:MAG: DUF2937 family protein [Psychromonas sp.]